MHKLYTLYLFLVVPLLLLLARWGGEWIRLTMQNVSAKRLETTNTLWRVLDASKKAATRMLNTLRL